jgi:formate dehydrogenase major subunit
MDPSTIKRGLHASLLHIGGKGREHQQQRPMDAVALPGAQAPRKQQSDGHIIAELGHKIKELYKKGGVFPGTILNLKWDYENEEGFDAIRWPGNQRLFPERRRNPGNRLQEKEPCSGFCVAAGRRLHVIGELAVLQNSSHGSRQHVGKKRAGRRPQQNRPVSSICMGAGRSTAGSFYNRASVDPRDSRKTRKSGSSAGTNQVARDVPDGGWPPLQTADGKPNPAAGIRLSCIRTDHGHLFGPGLNDGPFPEHYEPLECPVKKLMNPKQRMNPTAPVYDSEMDKTTHGTCDPRFPYVCSTYRVTEHWQTGLMTRPQAWLLECQPQMFVEMSEELAKLKGISNGERVMVSSSRGQVDCTAIVTKRFKPFKIAGTIIHQVGIPWCFGWRWPETGTEESANLVTPSTGDANTRIPESKAFMVNVTKKI